MRVGYKMARVVALATGSPIARIDAAHKVGPHGSLQYGYAIVNRCIRAGLVRVTSIEGRRGVAIIAV